MGGGQFFCMIFRVPATIWMLCKPNLMILTRVTPTLLPLEVNGVMYASSEGI